MKKLYFLSLALALALVQATILDHLKIFGVKPDLLLLMALASCLYFRAIPAIAFCVLAGFLKDLFAPSSLGVNTLLFTLWGLLVIRLNKKITIEQDSLRLLLAFSVSLVQNICYGLILFYSGKIIPLGISLRIILLQSLYTAILFPLIFRIFRF